MAWRTAAISSSLRLKSRGKMGGEITTFTGPGRTRRLARAWMKRVPLMETGAMGWPAFWAMMNTPFLKGSSSPTVARVPSGKDNHGGAGLDAGRGGIQAADGGGLIGAVHRDITHAGEGLAEDGDLEEGFFGYPEKFAGQHRDQYKDIEIGPMVGGIDVSLTREQVLQALYLEGNPGEVKQGPAPPAGHHLGQVAAGVQKTT